MQKINHEIRVSFTGVLYESLGSISMPSKDSDQTVHMHSLIRVFARHSLDLMFFQEDSKDCQMMSCIHAISFGLKSVRSGRILREI